MCLCLFLLTTKLLFHCTQAKASTRENDITGRR
jgi:hypothetical protein